jgi:di/tricarboxylate transporter
MITFEGYVVIAVIIFLIVSLYLNKIGPGYTFMIGIAILGIFRVLTPADILAGFANEQVAVIIMLLLLGNVIKTSGILDGFFEYTFAKTTSYKMFMGKMLVMISSFSAFLNNTPLVAILMPYTISWSKRNGISPSKLLIPLSYAAILGGCITLIGTASNLLVAGMVANQKVVPEMKQLGIFDFSIVGIPMAIAGIAYLIFFGKRMLPDRADIMNKVASQNREYIAEVRIANGEEFHGKTIETAGLRNLKGLFLVEIVRGEQSIKPVSPATRLMENDILLFAGETTSITEMVAARTGLQLAQIGMYAKKSQTSIVEVVVSHNSTLISKTAKETNFRSRYDAAIVAIHRNGERVTGKIGEVPLVAGDVLLMLTGEDFQTLIKDSQDFYLISKLQEFKRQPLYKQVVLLGGFVLAILASVIGLVKLFTALLILLLLIFSLKMVSPKDIGKSIDFNLLIILALSLALGTAMVNSGIATQFAHFSFKIFKPFGIVGILIGIFIITNLLTSVLANAAAVAIVFPIALTMAVDIGVDPKPFILIVAFAGAASFLTPIGYQTNLMVFGPGGYHFKDFIKIGLPLTILYMIVAVLGLVYQFNIHL